MKFIKCLKCGEELTAEDLFCTNCGTRLTQSQLESKNTMNHQPVSQQNVISNNQNLSVVSSTESQITKETNTPNMLCIISLALNFGSPIIIAIIGSVLSIVSENVAMVISSILGVLGSLAPLVIMIYVRIKYPTNTFGKILMWIYIAGIILYIILLILTVVACVSCITIYGQ